MKMIPNGVFGTISEEGRYVNSYYGFSIAFDFDYLLYENEMLAEVNGIKTHRCGEMEMTGVLYSNGNVYALVAANQIGDNYSLSIQNIEVVYEKELNGKEIASLMKDSLEQSMPSMGYTNGAVECRSVEFLGKRVTATYMHAVGDRGVPFFQLELYMVDENGIAGIVTVASVGEDLTADMLGKFEQI